MKGEGVLVNEVFDKDPAAAAGIKPGDILTRIDGTVIDTPNRLSRVVAGLLPGSTTKVEIVRDQQRLVLDVALIERPRPRRDHLASPGTRLRSSSASMCRI